MEYGKSHPAQDKPLPTLQEKSAISLVPELCTTLNNVLSFFLPTFSLNLKIFSSDSLILSPVAVVSLVGDFDAVVSNEEGDIDVCA